MSAKMRDLQSVRLSESLDEAAKRQNAHITTSSTMFPNRHGGLKGACSAKTPLDRGGIQITPGKVALSCGVKKRSRLTVCAIAFPRI